MKPLTHIISGFAVCGFALSLSIANAHAADSVEPKGYPWTSQPAPAAAPVNTASDPTAGSQPSKKKWVAPSIAGRAIAAPAKKAADVARPSTVTQATQAAPRPGRPALSVARPAVTRKASPIATAPNRRVAYQTRRVTPGILAQHKTVTAQPVVPQARPATSLTARSVLVSQDKAEAEALPDPLELPSEGELVEEEWFAGAQPGPILSLLTPPWQRGGLWQDLDCCVGDFCPIGKILCALGQVTDYSEFSSGVHAYKDPVDMGSNGNFGFHVGVNTSGALFPWRGIGYQAGVNILSSDLSGHNTGNVASSEDRFTSFTTVGVFRRQMGTGFQGGVVWDWRHDEFYQDYDVHQVRGELSFKHQCTDEFGIWFTVNTRDDRMTRVGAGSDSVISTNELYAFFFRRSWECGGEGRLYAGFSGESDGIIGGDIRLPINERWSIDTQATYLVPNETDGLAGTTAESWGLGISLVWTPKYGTSDGAAYPFRALLPVASPASMMGIFK